MEADQLADQRQTDAAAFEAAAAGAADAMEALEQVRAARPAGMPVPVSRTVSTATAPPRGGRRSRSTPSRVNLKALESRLRTTFSHISRSTATGSSKVGQSTVKVRPALSIVDRKTLAISAVSLPRSTGSCCACSRPASMREKSSSVLTSFKQPLAVAPRDLERAGATSAGRPSAASACSSGPSISASGVRNSWLTFEKNVVLARSSSANASARWRSSSAPGRWRSIR